MIDDDKSLGERVFIEVNGAEGVAEQIVESIRLEFSSGGVLGESGSLFTGVWHGGPGPEEIVLPSADGPTSRCTRQRVLVCTTCNAVVARSKEVSHLYDEPVLFASEMECGLQQHEQTTGHRAAREEVRVLYVGQERDEEGRQ